MSSVALDLEFRYRHPFCHKVAQLLLAFAIVEETD